MTQKFLSAFLLSALTFPLQATNIPAPREENPQEIRQAPARPPLARRDAQGGWQAVLFLNRDERKVQRLNARMNALSL